MRSASRAGSRTGGCTTAFPVEVGVVQRGRVVLGGGHGDAEEVADAAQVAAAGVGFVDDSILTQCLGGHAESVGDPGAAGRAGGGRGQGVDEEVRVDAVGPASVALVEVGVQACL